MSEAGTASVAAPPKPYDGATQGYAASPTPDSTPLAYDVITGFAVGNDHLRLPASGVLTGTFDATATGVANLTIERASVGAYETFAGIKTSMSTNDTISFTYDSQSYTVTLSNGITNLQADIDAAAAVCAPAHGANHVAASFVGDDLVLTAVGDGVAGMGATDIMVKLAGVQVTDFTSIYTHSKYIF